MKTLAWILGILASVLLIYVVYSLVAPGRRRADSVASVEVSADSIRAYMDRAEELGIRADSLRARLTELRLVDRPSVQFRIAALERELAGLRQAIDEWRVARTGVGGPAAFRQCVLLYGKASGVCDALALDTLH
ncbi:hypothetical protein FJY69_03680 [candidate division WOR-3 bacterium]|nr:hypothetical protein [candidate division WOR-3 bacterium]